MAGRLIKYLFTALATGGAVVVSQYIGQKSEKLASESVSQLLMISTLVSLAMTALECMDCIWEFRVLPGLL